MTSIPPCRTTESDSVSIIYSLFKSQSTLSASHPAIVASFINHILVRMECLHYDILVVDTLSTLGLLNECNDLINGVGPPTSSSNAAVNLCSQDEFKYEYALKERIQRLLNRLKTVDKRNGSLDDEVEEGSNVEFTDSCSCSTQDHSNNTITRPPTVATEDEIRTLCQTAHVAIADAVSFGVCVWYIQVGFSQIWHSHCNFRCHRTRQQNSITLNNSYPSLTLSCMVMSQ